MVPASVAEMAVPLAALSVRALALQKASSSGMSSAWRTEDWSDEMMAMTLGEMTALRMDSESAYHLGQQ